MPRDCRAKIVATIRPARSDTKTIAGLFDTGAAPAAGQRLPPGGQAAAAERRDRLIHLSVERWRSCGPRDSNPHGDTPSGF